MDFLSLLGPLLSIGTNLFGAIGGQTEGETTNGSSSTGAETITRDSGTDKTSRLDKTTNTLLTQQVQGLLKSSQTGNKAINSRISQLSGQGDFDVNGFVSGIMQGANSTARKGLESGIAQISDATGGNASTNSAAALLGNTLRTDTASQLARTQSEATAQGEALRGQRSAELASLTSAASGSLSSLLNPLLSANETRATDTLQRNAVKQKTKSASSTKNQKNDWEKFWTGLGKGFNANFVPPAP